MPLKFLLALHCVGKIVIGIYKRTMNLETNPFGNNQNRRYGSILLADGRSLKDLCKELADQSKLGDRAKQVARTRDSKLCSGCGEQDDLASCQGCEAAWCNNCAKNSSGTGQYALSEY